MKDVMKKVVILENLSSPYVHQAIIVMRDYNPKLESLAVIEAERIVSAYLDNMKIEKKKSRPSRTSHKKHPLFLAIMSASIITLIAIAFIMKH
ncbi:MAG: hypothetical protein J1G06_08945 [Oscillospiraceae bacterium]|nr:hypothetical protein [Oscillospiraceae bacterium]